MQAVEYQRRIDDLEPPGLPERVDEDGVMLDRDPYAFGQSIHGHLRRITEHEQRSGVRATGNLEQNQQLAKQRAMNVRDALKAAGIAEDRIDLKKPEQTQGSGDNPEARRVEVRVM